MLERPRRDEAAQGEPVGFGQPSSVLEPLHVPGAVVAAGTCVVPEVPPFACGGEAVAVALHHAGDRGVAVAGPHSRLWCHMFSYLAVWRYGQVQVTFFLFTCEGSRAFVTFLACPLGVRSNVG